MNQLHVVIMRPKMLHCARVSAVFLSFSRPSLASSWSWFCFELIFSISLVCFLATRKILLDVILRKLNVKNNRNSITIQNWFITSWQPCMEQRALTNSFIPSSEAPTVYTVYKRQDPGVAEANSWHRHHADIQHNRFHCCPKFSFGKSSKTKPKTNKTKAKTNTNTRQQPCES